MQSRFARTLFATCLLALPITEAVSAQVGMNASGRSRRVIRGPEILDFETDPAGTNLFTVYGSRGSGPIAIRALNPALGGVNSALVFDSAAPTGEDPDLGTPNEDFGGPGTGAGGESGARYQNDRALNNVLIVGEDLVDANNDDLVDDPDDADVMDLPVKIEFRLIAPVTVHRLTVMDIEGFRSSARIEVLDEDGALLGQVPLPNTGDNGVADVDINIGGAATVLVYLEGSGAIDDVVYQRECDATLGDKIWVDLDRDGIQDPSEPGLEGVTVQLKDATGGVVGAVATDRTGTYLFSGLCPGDYTVDVVGDTLPQDYVASPCEVGDDEDADSNCLPAAITLDDFDTNELSVDFGFNSPCAGVVSGNMWHDIDRDCELEATDIGLEGVRVDLLNVQGVRISSATTGPDGFYAFLGLCAGTYTVFVDQTSLPIGFDPEDCGFAFGGSGTLDIVLPTDSSVVEDASVPFVAEGEGEIGNYVWFDDDCNSVQNNTFLGAGDHGIEDVGFFLLDDMSTIIERATSDGNGNYRFTGLAAGSYTIVVDTSTLPAAYVPAECNVGTDETVDNDCSPADVELASDQTIDLTVDFGYTTDPCGVGGAGCTPGYWKQSHHFDSWPDEYHPDMLFSVVFEDAFGDQSLVEVLASGGGGLTALGRHTVAALLNAASPEVEYDLTPTQVIDLFNDVYPGTVAEYLALKDYFADLNEQGCVL